MGTSNVTDEPGSKETQRIHTKRTTIALVQRFLYTQQMDTLHLPQPRCLLFLSRGKDKLAVAARIINGEACPFLTTSPGSSIGSDFLDDMDVVYFHPLGGEARTLQEVCVLLDSNPTRGRCFCEYQGTTASKCLAARHDVGVGQSCMS
jgi:hypothetical protein